MSKILDFLRDAEMTQNGTVVNTYSNLIALMSLTAAIIAILFVVFTAKKVLKFSQGTEKMAKISASISSGANAFLKRQYSIVGIFFACMFVIIFLMAIFSNDMLLAIPFAFLSGGFFSGLSGSIMRDMASNITEMAFDYLDAPPAVFGSRNWITPAFEFEKYFFPQAEGIIDVINQKLMPIPGYVNTINESELEHVARSKAGL